MTIEQALEINLAAASSYPDIAGILLIDTVYDVECFTTIFEDIFVIAFRGTESLDDVIQDIKFWKKRIPYENKKTKIRVHAGFIQSYKLPAIRNRLHDMVIQNNLSKIFITGYSYGGALATLCAVDMQYWHPHKEISIITFGSPRVGNAAFVKSFNQRISNNLRVKNGFDIVPSVPPFWCFYKHVKNKVKVGKRHWWQVFNHSFSDHLLYSYRDSIFKK